MPPGYGRQIWPPCRWPDEDRGRSGPARAGRGRAGSGRAGSRSRRVRVARSSRVEPRLPRSDERRVDAGDPDPPATQLHEPPRRSQQRRRLELAEVRRLRLRIAADRDVVVAEHGVRGAASRASAPAARLAARVREQVARDRDEIRLPLAHPARPPRRRRAPATGRRSGSRRDARCAGRRARPASRAPRRSSSRSRRRPRQPLRDRAAASAARPRAPASALRL